MVTKTLLTGREPADSASHWNRRSVLKGAAGLLAVCAGTTGRAAPVFAAPGIQLYTLRGPLSGDFKGTLAALHKIGYRYVETAGLLGHDAAEFRAALDSTGLSAPSAHIFPNAAQPLLSKMANGQLRQEDAWSQIDAMMDIDRLDATVAEMVAQSKIVGNEYLVLASLDSSLLKSMTGISKIAAAFNRAGSVCQQNGLKFAFHPHLEEWATIEGKRAAEHILDATDPSRVLVELDFFWAVMMNVNVPQFLSHYSGRIHLGHIKDLAKGVVVPPAGFTEFSQVNNEFYEDVGYGQLDYRSWIPMARKAGMRYFFVERDYSPDPIQSAGRSLEPLRKLIGA